MSYGCRDLLGSVQDYLFILESVVKYDSLNTVNLIGIDIV